MTMSRFYFITIDKTSPGASHPWDNIGKEANTIPPGQHFLNMKTKKLNVP